MEGDHIAAVCCELEEGEIEGVDPQLFLLQKRSYEQAKKEITLQEMRPYKQAKKEIAVVLRKDRLTFEEADHALMCEDSYSRIGAIVHIYRKLDRNEWLRLLGDHWSGCDNISAFHGFLEEALGKAGPINEMMNDAEQAAFDELPEVLTVYRGCGKHNIVGVSWSLNRAVAEKFPSMTRYKVQDPLLVTAEVKKEQVIALKLDRDEHEVITFSAKRIMVEPLFIPSFTNSI